MVSSDDVDATLSAIERMKAQKNLPNPAGMGDLGKRRQELKEYCTPKVNREAFLRLGQNGALHSILNAYQDSDVEDTLVLPGDTSLTAALIVPFENGKIVLALSAAAGGENAPADVEKEHGKH